jgi:hypothetical protein
MNQLGHVNALRNFSRVPVRLHLCELMLAWKDMLWCTIVSCLQSILWSLYGNFVSFYVSVGMLYDHLKDGNMRRMYKVERIPSVLLKVMKIFDLLLKKLSSSLWHCFKI